MVIESLFFFFKSKFLCLNWCVLEKWSSSSYIELRNMDLIELAKKMASEELFEGLKVKNRKKNK